MTPGLPSSSATYLAFFFGALAGATVGLLVAPASGRATRDTLEERFLQKGERALQAASRRLREKSLTLRAAVATQRADGGGRT